MKKTNHPMVDLKEEWNSDLPLVVQTIGLCFNHLDFWSSGNVGLQYPSDLPNPHSTLKETPILLKLMINFFQYKILFHILFRNLL